MHDERKSIQTKCLITKQIVSVRNRIDYYDSNPQKNEYANNGPNWVDYIAETLLNRVSLSLLVSYLIKKNTAKRAMEISSSFAISTLKLASLTTVDKGIFTVGNKSNPVVGNMKFVYNKDELTIFLTPTKN